MSYYLAKNVVGKFKQIENKEFLLGNKLWI